jgi:hypothetical protein
MSVQVGTPNACKARKGFQHYAAAFHAAWVDQADAETLLTEVALDRSTPAFARASALTALASHLSAPNLDLVRKALADPDPMVRIGALDMSENSYPSKLWPLASPLLSDSSRGVRIRAAALLAAVPTANQPAADRDAFERAAAEFVEAQRLNADRPEAHTTLRNFYARRGCGDRIQDRAPAQSTVCPCGGKPRRFLPATRTRWRGREHIALIHRRDPK